jgi:hypothetical protein
MAVTDTYTDSPNLGLDVLGKRGESTHFQNAMEANWRTIDTLCQPTVEGVANDSSSTTQGVSYIVDDTPAGNFSTFSEHDITTYTGAGISIEYTGLGTVVSAVKSSNSIAITVDSTAYITVNLVTISTVESLCAYLNDYDFIAKKYGCVEWNQDSNNLSDSTSDISTTGIIFSDSTTNNGWTAYTPLEGYRVHDKSTTSLKTYTGSSWSNNWQVVGDLGVAGDVEVAGYLSVGSTSHSDDLHIAPSGTGRGITIDESDSANDAIRAIGYANSGFFGVYLDGDLDSVINGSGDSYFNLGGGNVGIGTSSPSGIFHTRNNADGGLPADIGTVNNIFQRNPNTASGVAVTLIGGTAAGCKINFGDSDNADQGGVYYDNSTDEMTFRTNNTNKVVIGETGMDITTVAVASTLYLHNTTSGTGTGNGFFISLEHSTTDAYMGLRENADMYFRTNNTNRIKIDSGGNVGIGTDSPVEALNVNGTIALAPVATDYYKAGVDQHARISGIYDTFAGGSSMHGGLLLQTRDTAGGRPIIFAVGEDGASRMWFNTTGLGIGTTPTELLQAQKDQDATTMIQVVNDSTGSSARSRFSMSVGGSEAAYINAHYVYGSSTDLIIANRINNDNADIIFKTKDGTRTPLTIKGSGHSIFDSTSTLEGDNLGPLEFRWDGTNWECNGQDSAGFVMPASGWIRAISMQYTKPTGDDMLINVNVNGTEIFELVDTETGSIARQEVELYTYSSGHTFSAGDLINITADTMTDIDPNVGAILCVWVKLNTWAAVGSVLESLETGESGDGSGV